MHHSPAERDQYRKRIMDTVKNRFHIEDLSGVEVFSSLNRIVQMVEIIDTRASEDGQTISGARWRLLLHLFLSEEIGKSSGLTPTELSRFQQVSKNTVSSLLRGLEDQGYIVRELDPLDLRIFRIRISDSGRRLIEETAPKRIQALNQMVGCLDGEEVEQLSRLLKKLHISLEKQFCQV